jgi:hypothetical protein
MRLRLLGRQSAHLPHERVAVLLRHLDVRQDRMREAISPRILIAAIAESASVTRAPGSLQDHRQELARVEIVVDD